MRKIIAAFVAPVLVVVALVVGASTANAQPTGSIDIVLGDGQLIAKGAVATVPMEVICSFSGNLIFADINASLRQVKGKTLVAAPGAFGGVSAVTCDGTPHTVDVTFFADAPWNPGVAVVNASMVIAFFDPDTGETGSASDSQGPTEIKLKN